MSGEQRIQRHMHFTGEAQCPRFEANPFRKNICASCNGLISRHHWAEPAQVADAIEYSVDTWPSRVWSLEANGCCLYLGGYKASLNRQFLTEASVGLIVNAAPQLEALYGSGSKVSKAFKLRREDPGLAHLEELPVHWVDDPKQEIRLSDLDPVLASLHRCLHDRGMSALVHCAQGKSRSAAITVAFVARQERIPVDVALERIRASRSMADPNPGFMAQLRDLDRNGFLGNRPD